MNFFFIIYGFHLNIFFTIKDDYSKREVFAARKVAEKFESEGKKLAER
jgi:hypothetical protein